MHRGNIMFLRKYLSIQKNRFKILFISSSFLSALLIFAQSAVATTVQFQTVMGDFTVNLYDKTTPKNVENFLAYVKAGAYTNSVIHRSIPEFVVQGGGYKYDTKFPLIDIPQNTAVINEPVYSNIRGTIAMAKLDGKPNSATNQWFFNLKDNSKSLDINIGGSGGYTVFGEVTSNGMAIVDAMAALSTFNIDNAGLKSFPLKNYTKADGDNHVAITDKNLALILGVVILDGSPDTASNLTPAKNTLINAPVDNGSSSGGGGGGGGSIGWMNVLLLLGFAFISRSRR